jgi:hypothetical protein
MGTPPWESGLLKDTLAVVCDNSITFTPWGLDGTSTKEQMHIKHNQVTKTTIIKTYAL